LISGGKQLKTASAIRIAGQRNSQGNRMTARSSLTVVLAAGEGTRMRSSLPKVLHPVAGQSLLAHVLDAAPHGTGAALAVVIGPDHKAVADEVARIRPDAATFIQAERLGTAHAVLAARAAIARGTDDLLVAFGDTPLISAETFARLRAPLEQGAALAVLGFRAADPTGYGRLLLEGDRLMAIREHADATEEERKVTLCNAGVMAFDGHRALEILDRIGNANSKGEYYLVDAVAIVREMGLEAVVIETSEDEVRGINNKSQLAEAEGPLKLAVDRAPKSVLAQRALVTYYLAARRPEDAEAPLKALAETVGTADVRLALADLYVGLGRIDAARALLKAVAQDPAGFAEATVRLKLIGPGRNEEKVEAVLDTGFTGFLTLSNSVVDALGLSWAGTRRATLADGRVVALDVYIAIAKWHAEEREILVLETEGGALLGMSLLYGSQVVLDVVEGGDVLIQPLS
jgi:clan AA aspartic protease